MDPGDLGCCLLSLLDVFGWGPWGWLIFGLLLIGIGIYLLLQPDPYLWGGLCGAAGVLIVGFAWQRLGSANHV
ncbi:MAG: TMEM43 family protein [bacterium]|nr:TMEM43 family protein [bacterium]